MEQTNLKCLRKGRPQVHSTETEGKLPELDITHVQSTPANVDNLDTFWQETILDIQDSDTDFLSHKLHHDCNAVDRRALTISWLSAHGGGQKRSTEKGRNKLKKSKSLERENEESGMESNDEFGDPMSSGITRARSSEHLLNVSEEDNESETDGQSSLSPRCHTLGRYRREVSSDYDISSSCRSHKRNNCLRRNDMSDSEDSLPFAHLTNRQHSGSSGLLPNLTASRRSTPLSPLFLEGRFSPTGSSQGLSLASSPVLSPVLTPGRHRQFQFLINTELPSGSLDRRVPGGAKSLPSSPRVGKKGLLSVSEMRKESKTVTVIKSDPAILHSHRFQNEGRLVHGGGAHAGNRGNMSARSERGLHRPDTPILKLRCRTVSGLQENSRMYSSCSDLPKVEEN